LSQLRGALQPLDWESQFFALPTAIVRLSEDAPLLAADDLAAWQRLQAKIPATRADWLDALQQQGFRLVEGEVDLAINVTQHACPGAEIATEQDIPALRQLAAQYLHALFDGVRVNGVEPHPEEISRRRVAEKMPRAGLNQHPGVGGAPGQLLSVDLLRRGQPERVGVFAAGDDAALRQMLL